MVKLGWIGLVGLVVADGYAPPFYHPKTFKGRHGAVAADSSRCSRVGVDLLKNNGSAIDAVIGAALCQGIVYPFASGIGGGGFMIVKHLKSEGALFIDFREVAPNKATKDMYSNASSTLGGLSVAVPGELRGFEVAHKRFGRLPWRKVLAPAIKLAQDGHPATQQLVMRLAKKWDLIKATHLASEYTNQDGTFIKVGQIVKHPKLAATLRKVANEGADAFYTGEIARKLVRTIQGDGGIITERDLAGYQPKVHPALKGTVLGRTMYFPPPPASGAVTYHILKLMEALEASRGASDEFTPSYAHRLIESFKLGYAGRSLLGDPAYTHAGKEVNYLTDDGNLRAQTQLVSDAKTFEAKHYFRNIAPAMNPDTHGTSHLSAVDSYGLAVSMTTTINLEFGSKLVCPETGVLLNDEMDDFSTPGAPNAFGLAPSKANFIQPGKRPFSSMTPVILQSKFDLLLIGGSGGSRITTGVAQTILNLLHLKRQFADAIALGRLHHQLAPNEIRVEAFGFALKLLKELRNRNHTLITFNAPESVINGIYATRQSHRCPTTLSWLYRAVTDPRKGGTAAAY